MIWRNVLRSLVPLAALLSFCGGPLNFFDAISSAAGTPFALILAFGPVVIAAACAFSLFRGHRLSLGTAGAIAGLLAVILVAAMNGFAIAEMLQKPLPRPDFLIFLAGAAMGLAATASYLWLAGRRFRGKAP